MSDQHKISEYIEKMSFKKKLGVGFSPDEVYEAICDLTSMYNDVLAKSYQEVEELRSTLEDQEKKSEPPMARELPPLQKPSATVPPSIKDTPPLPKHPVYQPTAKAMTGSTFTYQSVPNDIPEPPMIVKDERSADQLKHTSRQELLELLLASRKENEQLSKYAQEVARQNKILIEQLKDKQIKINKAGTLAEATFMLNGVFDSVNLAASQYLDNLQSLYDREEARQEESRQKAQQLLDDASSQCEKLIKDSSEKCLAMEIETRTACDIMKSKAKADADLYWKEVSEKLENFYEAHEGLKALLQNSGQFPGGDVGQ